MNEDFYNSVHFELASEIGQKAVIIATLQAQLKNCREYTQKLEEEKQDLQKAKDELQADFDAESKLCIQICIYQRKPAKLYRFLPHLFYHFKKKKKNFKTNSMN